MKTKIAVSFLLLIGMFLAGCNTAALLNNIRIGMTKVEVIQILGQPDSTSAQANIEYLTYYLYADSRSGYGDQPYSVRLVDGKVESFGRFMQLFDIYNRPVVGSSMAAPLWTPQSSQPDIAVQLQRLKALKDQGALTAEEYEKAKARLLNK